MKILNIVDPNFLASLDRRKNIIMCTPPNDNCLIEAECSPDTFGITLSRDLNISGPDVVRVSSNIIATTIRPEIKISFPIGLKIQFSEFMEDFKQDIFLRIYKAFDQKVVFEPETEVVSHNLIGDMIFRLYIDTTRMRENETPMMIKKGTRVTDFYFTWYVQTKRDMPQIEEIYLISDAQVYEDFVNIF